MIYGIIVAIVWIICGILAYKFFFSKWESASKTEKIWYSCVWPVILPLYGIHYLHNNVF